jgi:hypothetical protein
VTTPSFTDCVTVTFGFFSNSFTAADVKSTLPLASTESPIASSCAAFSPDP